MSLYGDKHIAEAAGHNAAAVAHAWFELLRRIAAAILSWIRDVFGSIFNQGKKQPTGAGAEAAAPTVQSAPIEAQKPAMRMTLFNTDAPVKPLSTEESREIDRGLREYLKEQETHRERQYKYRQRKKEEKLNAELDAIVAGLVRESVKKSIDTTTAKDMIAAILTQTNLSGHIAPIEAKFDAAMLEMQEKPEKFGLTPDEVALWRHATQQPQIDDLPECATEFSIAAEFKPYEDEPYEDDGPRP